MPDPDRKRVSALTACVLCVVSFGVGLFVSPNRQAPAAASDAASAAAPAGSSAAPALGCESARQLVERGDVEAAIIAVEPCAEGAVREAVVAAIDAAVLKRLDEKGCEVKPLIKAASRVGALSARQPYIDKGCR